MNYVLLVLLKVLSSELTKNLIAMGINKLLKASDDGITKELAMSMIEGIAKSKSNPTTEEAFSNALELLK